MALRLEVHTRWPFSWVPKFVSGYDANKVSFVIGFTWCRAAVFLTRFWNRNGCVHDLDRIAGVRWYP